MRKSTTINGFKQLTTASNKSSTVSLNTKKVPKSKKVPSGQPYLLDFLKKNNHETSITMSASSNDPGPLAKSLPNEADEDSFFLLLLAVKKDLGNLKPVLLHVHGKDIPKKKANEITVIVRFRLNNESFIGRIMMISRE